MTRSKTSNALWNGAGTAGGGREHKHIMPGADGVLPQLIHGDKISVEFDAADKLFNQVGRLSQTGKMFRRTSQGDKSSRAQEICKTVRLSVRNVSRH